MEDAAFVQGNVYLANGSEAEIHEENSIGKRLNVMTFAKQIAVL